MATGRRRFVECNTHGRQPLTRTHADWFSSEACLECVIASSENYTNVKLAERAAGGMKWWNHGEKGNPMWLDLPPFEQT